MSDPRRDFVANIDLDKTRIGGFPGFIFLCGGGASQIVDRPSSFREFLTAYLNGKKISLGAKVVQAEQFADWFRFDIYRDLISFEEHLASLAKIIFLIVESPGSIAELGAFSQIASIAEKLLILVNQHDLAKDSFIKLGPLLQLKNKEQGTQVVFPWDFAIDEKVNIRFVDKVSAEPIAEEAVKEIVAAISSVPKEQKFRKDDPGHQMLLIDDLAKIMAGLKLSEIKDYFDILGIDADQKKIKGYLFVLEKLEIIDPSSYGHDEYYFSRNIIDSYVSYGQKTKDRRDRVNIFEGIYNYLEESDKRRVGAFKSHAASKKGAT